MTSSLTNSQHERQPLRKAETHSWYCLESGVCDAAFNMALDEALVGVVSDWKRPVLRFYGWKEPAASFGYFQRYHDVEQLTPLRPLIRRPTGGGIVPHDNDWTYSLAFPTHDEWYALTAKESYRRVHQWIQQAFTRLGLETELAPAALKTQPGRCFVGHEESDLLWHGRKIAGAAQRRRKDGLLIQGSVQSPLSTLKRTDWEKAMREVAGRVEPVSWTQCSELERLLARAADLSRAKYSLASYNRQR